MDIIHLKKPIKPLAEAGRDLGLPSQFASVRVQPEAFALLVQHVDQLRLDVELLRFEQRRRWWHPIRDAVRRWRLLA